MDVAIDDFQLVVRGPWPFQFNGAHGTTSMI
jgi:hypothetical protein